MTEASNNRKRLLLIGGGLVALGVVAFIAFAVWFLQDDAPDEVAIDSAAAQVAAGAETTDDTTSDSTTDDTTAATDAPSTDGTTATTGADSTDAPAADGDLSGTWSVDTSIGEFSFADSTGTFVGFRVQEELSSIGSTTAVGRTPEVSGTLVIDGSTITEVSVEADMTSITTDDSRRDNRVQSALNTSENPTATFVLTSPITLDDAAFDGEPVTLDAAGDLTINGVTQSVTFPLTAQLVENTIVVVGSLDVVFADYDVEVPSAPIVVSAEDNGPIELQLFFTR
ncbi:YceI-like domain-containing protein [Ilumatobacter fluminis]|uniref:YceI-like domain-containing protein n=1 Tax=Ilumatobacter fluminis TaxID=467091 RepID=A0A4R7HWZ7_9ACTN|nr:YceI family protein [Ilumatobacter fluminis]TDT14989.1 YceI-like domain-containing protein [Ilumatobacter fluminis]